uniref:Uncharacterized protein n=1 Tax=Rhizophora mucronata TaxID=61149 RepID=A0A2P2NYD1_RHIMU
MVYENNSILSLLENGEMLKSLRRHT